MERMERVKSASRNSRQGVKGEDKRLSRKKKIGGRDV